MKQCKECGTDFEPKNPKGVFCSTACRQKDYRKKIAENLRFLEKNQSASSKVISPELADQIAENNKPENKARILKERNIITPFKAKLNEYGVPDNPPSEETGRQVVSETSTGKVSVLDSASLAPPSFLREDRQKSIADQIKAIKAEKVPKERDTSNGRKSWAFDQQKRIKELEIKLK